MFKKEYRNWIEYRELPDLWEYDFHRSDKQAYFDHWELMEQVYDETLKVLKVAQAKGYQHVLFTHGWSTSRPGATTTRSQIRKLMKSKDATPYIIRKNCIQHESVFVAAIKPKTK